MGFSPDREVGKDILFVTDVSKTIDGVKVLDKVSFIVGHGDKIAFIRISGLPNRAWASRTFTFSRGSRLAISLWCRSVPTPKPCRIRLASYTVMDTVIMGNLRLYEIGKEKEALYAKEEMTDEDGMLYQKS